MTPEITDLLWLAGALGFVGGIGATVLLVAVATWVGDWSTEWGQ